MSGQSRSSRHIGNKKIMQKYDAKADALYITLGKGKVYKTKKVRADLFDYDKEGNLLGLEILNYSERKKGE